MCTQNSAQRNKSPDDVHCSIVRALLRAPVVVSAEHQMHLHALRPVCRDGEGIVGRGHLEGMG